MNGGFTRLIRYAGLLALVSGEFWTSQAGGADSFDWRSVGGNNWNTAPNWQISGTCWNFSACGTLEAKYMLTRNDPYFLPDVSEQNIEWEGTMGSMGGGWGSSVLNYFTSHGVVTEGECPEKFTDPPTVAGDPWPLAAGWTNRVFKSVSNSNNFTHDTATMKTYLKTNGPLEVGLSASNDLFGSVADLKANYRAPGGGCDHEVSLVGYYDDASVPSGGYWVIKNSWGLGEGEGGYDYVPYGNIEYHNDVSAITGSVNFTGPMYRVGTCGWLQHGKEYFGSDATNTWKGTASSVWDTTSGASANWVNNGAGGTLWVNQEQQAVFDSTGANRAIALNSTVIAHGLTFNSGATGYSFSGPGGSLTITSGGMTANESVSFNVPVSIGGTQTWSIASGRTVTIGDLHTIINKLTLSGSGNTVITGSVDGGGVLNTYGGATPGTIIQSGSGTLSFTGAGTYGAPLTMNGGTLNFAQPSGAVGNFTAVIGGSRPVTKTNAGTIILAGLNSYSGSTKVSAGALQADSGVGLPNSSFLLLDGGVIQSNGAATFARTLGTSGSGKFEFTANGGGFAAGAGPMTVKINNGTSKIDWGTGVGSNIAGTLKFGSLTAANVVDFQNAIDLKGATGYNARTVQVDDNSASTADYAKISGVISNSGPVACGLQKTGNGLLILTATNTYNGPTTISGGALQANFGQGIPNYLSLDGGVLQSSITDASPVTFTYQLGAGAGQFVWTTGGGFSAGLGPLSVNVGGNATPSTVAWGSTVGTNLIGALKLGSPTSLNVTTFLNPLTLNGATGTIQVDDNPATAADYSVIFNVISDGSGSGGIQKAGGGLLLLNAANTYTGSTTIGGGALQADFGTGIPAASFLVLDGGVLQCNTAYNFTRPMGTSGATFLWTANGGGFAGAGGAMTVNVGGNATPDTLDWGTTIGGTLKLSSSSSAYATTFQNSLDLGGGDRTIRIDDNPNSTGDNVVLSGNIGGAGSLTFANTGQLTLTGSANSYAGSTTITGGTVDLGMTTGPAIPGNLNIFATTPGVTQVRLQRSGQIASSSAVSFSGSSEVRLILLGHSTTLAGISDSDGTAVIENSQDTTVSAATLTVNNATDCFYNGALRNSLTGSGTLSFTKSGAGSLTLLGSQITYTGATTVSGGTLQVGNGLTVGSIQTSASASVASGATLFFDRADGYFFTHRISGAGTVKIFQGVHSFDTSANTSLGLFSGPVNILSGAVYLRSASGLGSGSLNLGNGASLLLWTGTTTTFNKAITLNGIGTAVDNYSKPAIYGDGGGGTYTLSGQITLAATSDIGNYGGNGTMTISGKITGPGGLVLGKTNPTLADEYGAIAIGGTVSNDYSGGTTINRGTVYLQKSSNAIAIPGDIALSTEVYNGTGNTMLILKGNNQIASTGTMTFSGVAGSSPQYAYFDMNGKSQALAGINDTTGAGVIEHAETETSVTTASTLTINSAAADSSFNGYMRDGNYGAGSTGRFALVKNGSYQLTLSGANCGGYTGGLTVNGGTLDYRSGTLPSNGGSGTVYCPYTINGGTLNIGGLSASIGPFRITGGAVAGSGTLTSNAAYDVQAGTVGVVLGGSGIALNKTGSGTAILSNNDTLTGLTTVAAGTLQLGVGSSSGNVSGNISVGVNGTLDFNRSSSITYSSKLSGTGTLVKNGSGTLTMSGSNTFSGNLIVNSGTLSYGGNSSLPVGNYNVTGGTLSLGALSQSIGTLQITGGTVSGAGTLTGSAAFDVQAGTVNTILDGDVGLTKTSSGVVTLGGGNSYTGPTLISGGELALSASGQIDVSSLITNDALLSFEGETDHTVGVISGGGTTQVVADTSLTASSIAQGVLNIGVEVPSPAPPVATDGSSLTPVPEPNTLALLALAVVGLIPAVWRRK
jgi:fibronectin-binding autotransporter adhesin